MTKEKTVNNVEDTELYAIIKSKVVEIINMEEKEVIIRNVVAPFGTLNTSYKGHLLGFTTSYTFHKFPKFTGTVEGNHVVVVDGKDRDADRVSLELTKAIEKYTAELDERIRRANLMQSVKEDAVFSIELDDKKTTYINSAEVYAEDENGVDKVDAVNSALTIYSDKVGDIVIRANSRDGIVVEMPNESPSFNQNNFNTTTVDALINLGKQLEYRRDREANLEAIRTKYLEDAEAKVNTVMEEIESNTPEAIAKALEELDK